MVVWTIWMDKWGFIDRVYSDIDADDVAGCMMRRLGGKAVAVFNVCADCKNDAIAVANREREILVESGAFAREQAEIDDSDKRMRGRDAMLAACEY